MKQPKAFWRQCGPSWNISDGLGKKESALRGIRGTALQARGSRSVWKPSGHLTGSGLMDMRDQEKGTEGKGCRSILEVRRLTEVSGQEAGCWRGWKGVPVHYGRGEEELEEEEGNLGRSHICVG